MILPITVPYKDKIELATRLLNFYSTMVNSLGKADLEILTMALVYDVNSPDFKEILIDSFDSVTNNKQIDMRMTRMKKKKLIVPHRVKNRKVLHPHIEALRKIVQSGENKQKECNIGISLKFKKS